MKSMRWTGVLVAVGVLAAVDVTPRAVQTRALTNPALTGTVTSFAEGAMEGVVVIAQHQGSAVLTSVTTDAKGQYSFPQDHLTPGKYTISVRAVGYDLQAPTSVDVAAQTTRKDLALVTLTDRDRIASQLTSAEWLQSWPGTDEEKDRFWRRAANCGFCHNLEKVVRTKYTAKQWVPVIQRMASYDADHTTGYGRGLSQKLNQGPPGFDGYGNHLGTWWEYPMDRMGTYLETVNQSGGRSTWPYEFKILPRPKGRATRAIVTVYPIPRQPSVIHDVDVDSKGNVWYANSAWNYIGKLDPKTGVFSEWPLPPGKGGEVGGVGGILDHALDPEDNFWVGWQRKLAKFDARTEKWTLYDLPAGMSCGGFWALARPDSEMMWTGGSEGSPEGPQAGICRFNYKTAEARVFPLYKNAPPGPHRAYQTERDSKDNGYALDWGALWETPNLTHYVTRVDGKTGATKWYPTPTAKSFPRRGGMDGQDRLWFAEFWADKIGMFDTRAETFEEVPVGIKYASLYFARPDRNGEVWVSNFATDRLFRYNPKTKELTGYLIPEYYDSRKVSVGDSNTGKPTVWLGSKNTAHLIRVEPLD
jgi:streptogramin lyase